MRKSTVSNQFRKPGQAAKKVLQENQQRVQQSTSAGRNGLSMVKASIQSSDEEPEKPAPICPPPAKDSLRVSNETYKIISGLVSKVEAVARQRQSITKIHEAMVASINKGETPGITSVRFPQAPPGCSFSALFINRYTDKARSYGIRLACMLVAEYATQITQFNSDIELIVNEGEDTLATIEDADERRKAVKLFQLKYQAAVRRITRRMAKAKRRFHKL